MNLLRRYGLPISLSLYLSVLVGLNALGRYPRPGPKDPVWLADQPVVSLEGRVINFPSTRWNQTRFVLESPAGLAVVTLGFVDRELAPGDRVSVRGWLRPTRPPGPGKTFDESSYWASQGVYSVLKVWSPEGTRRIHRPRISLARAGWRFRLRFMKFWETHLRPEPAAFLIGLTVGARDGFPPDLKERCIRAGIYHMVVVSGLHVSLIAGLVFAAARLAGWPKRLAMLLVMPLVFLYTTVVGDSAPVMRAVWMAAATLLALAAGRDGPGYSALLIAAGALLVDEPEALFGASFQLSFISTASLMAILPWLEAPLSSHRRWTRWAYGPLLTTVAVQVGTWPVLVAYFGQLSVTGLAANALLIVPTGVLLVAGLGMGIFGSVFPPLVPEFAIDTISVLTHACLWIIDRCARPSWATVPIQPPAGPWILLYYGVLCGILYAVHAHRRKALSTLP